MNEFERNYIDNDGAWELDKAYQEYLARRKVLDDEFTDLQNKKSVVKPVYWYLASVYSSYPKGLEEAYKGACKMAALCRDNGIRVFCPIAHTHTTSLIMTNANSHDYWMQDDYMFLDNAKGLIVTMMDNWEQSKGINLEIEYTKKLGKPIIYTKFMEVPNIG